MFESLSITGFQYFKEWGNKLSSLGEKISAWDKKVETYCHRRVLECLNISEETYDKVAQRTRIAILILMSLRIIDDNLLQKTDLDDGGPCSQLARFHRVLEEGCANNLTSEINLLKSFEQCLGPHFPLKVCLANQQREYDVTKLYPYASNFQKESIKKCSANSNTTECDSKEVLLGNYANEKYFRNVNDVVIYNNERLAQRKTNVLLLDGNYSPYFDDTSVKIYQTLLHNGFFPLYKRVFKPIGICNAISSLAKKVNQIIIDTHGDLGILGFNIWLLTSLIQNKNTSKNQMETVLPDDCFNNLSDEHENHIYLISCKSAKSSKKVESVQDYFLKKMISSGKKGCVHASSKDISLIVQKPFNGEQFYQSFKPNTKDSAHLDIEIQTWDEFTDNAQFEYKEERKTCPRFLTQKCTD